VRRRAPLLIASALVRALVARPALAQKPGMDPEERLERRLPKRPATPAPAPG